MKVCIDLCSGEGGFSQAFEDPITIDIDRKFRPTIQADVNYLPLRQGLRPDILLMSPPCERFSLANPHWPKKGIKKALELVGACLEAVCYLKPKNWVLENPKGRLRWFIGKPRQTVRYSDYDMSYKAVKPTDFWGNVNLPMVKGERKGFVGHREKGWFRRKSKIPKGVSEAILEGIKNQEK